MLLATELTALTEHAAAGPGAHYRTKKGPAKPRPFCCSLAAGGAAALPHRGAAHAWPEPLSALLRR